MSCLFYVQLPLKPVRFLIETTSVQLKQITVIFLKSICLADIIIFNMFLICLCIYSFFGHFRHEAFASFA